MATTVAKTTFLPKIAYEEEWEFPNNIMNAGKMKLVQDI